MTAKRQRMATVLRVRRVQELQAAGDLARSRAAAQESERVLGALDRHYDGHRAIDHEDGPVATRLRDHQTRYLQAEAIQRARHRVAEAVEAMESRRTDLVVRTMAVRAMERLDERLADEEIIELRRVEIRDQDERRGVTAIGVDLPDATASTGAGVLA